MFREFKQRSTGRTRLRGSEGNPPSAKSRLWRPHYFSCLSSLDLSTHGTSLRGARSIWVNLFEGQLTHLTSFSRIERRDIAKDWRMPSATFSCLLPFCCAIKES